MRLLAEGGFPAEALAAVKRRSRAIRHNGTQLDWGGGRPGEADDGAAYINLSYRLEGQRAALRLLVWPDRWVWVDCRRSTKVGWAWACTIEGRFLARGGARTLIEKVEETLLATRSGDQVPERVARVWSSYLATGPRLTS